jgi:hypothetical protein
MFKDFRTGLQLSLRQTIIYAVGAETEETVDYLSTKLYIDIFEITVTIDFKYLVTLRNLIM